MKVSYGSCQIVKTSEDGKVDGIQFTISGNGVNQTVTTANGGKFQLDNLKIATVKVGSTTVVEMHNELRDTPKTGDNSNVGLWTALAGLSALGIVGTAVVAYRKKKKEDNE